MLAIRFVLSPMGFDQGAEGIGEDERNELVIMVNNIEQTTVIALIDFNKVGLLDTAGEHIGFQDIELLDFL